MAVANYLFLKRTPGVPKNIPAGIVSHARCAAMTDARYVEVGAGIQDNPSLLYPANAREKKNDTDPTTDYIN